jgi:hypothetical protein
VIEQHSKKRAIGIGDRPDDIAHILLGGVKPVAEDEQLHGECE